MYLIMIVNWNIQERFDFDTLPKKFIKVKNTMPKMRKATLKRGFSLNNPEYTYQGIAPYSFLSRPMIDFIGLP